MTLEAVVARHRARLGVVEGDAGVAIMTALIMVMLLGTLSMVVLALVISQVVPTQFGRKSTQTIAGAEAGVEASLSQIRSAAAAPDFTGSVYGSTAKLPCTVSGTVASATGNLTYSATVRYYKDDPAGRTASWLTTNKMPCTDGSGVTGQPRYAYITSTGSAPAVHPMSASSGNRTLSSIYQFQVTTTNVAGGRIYSRENTACLQATGTTAGSTIKYVLKASCGTTDDTELWLYDTDWKIKLASTVYPGSTAMCITGAPTSSTSDATATLQACKADTDSARWNQLWSWEGGAHWLGEKSDISGQSSACLYSGSTSGDPTGKTLMVGIGPSTNTKQKCANDVDWGSFNPDPAVGAGAASYTTHQVVSFLEFGRCFDVTSADVDSGYMIIYPCKQDPSPGMPGILWNHKWYYTEPPPGVAQSAPQQLYLLKDNSTSQKYCLVAPDAGGIYPKLTDNPGDCSATAQNQQWIRVRDTGNYNTSYLFKDYLDRCIGLSTGTDKHNGAWTKMVVAPCTGGLDQKWNAPPDKVEASVGNYLETAGG